MFTIKSTRYRSRLSSITRNIKFVNGDISGEIVFDDIIYLEVPRTKKCYLQTKITGGVWATAVELPTYIHQSGEHFGWFQKQDQNLLIQISF